MMEGNFIIDVIRMLLYGLDSIIYGLINTLYNLFIYVSNLTLFNSDDFLKFNNKVYLILGMVMLFKIAFSLISLFANPDNFSDSNKGVVGIVKRIVVSLVVITFIPTVFQTAYRIQSIILNDNIIGNFILGGIAKGDTQSDSEISSEIQKNAGKMISFNILSAFYYPEQFTLKYDQEGNLLVSDDKNGNKQYEFNVDLSSEACARNMNSGQIATEDCDGRLYYRIVNETYSIEDYGAFIKKEDDATGIYVMHYMFLISTIAGIVVAWMFLGFCIDVAVRSVKLSVLQLIAPIPVFSYIDPSKGEKIFKSWYETCISTYLSLFMRLILIYFVIYVCYIISGATGHGIQQFDANGVAVAIDGGGPTGIGKCLIYIGLLMFAKDAPKLFSEMFGVKMDGGSFGTKLAKMGIAGTGLAVGVGGAKYLGNRYRRKLQKKSNRGRIGELNDIEKDRKLDEDELKERAKLRTENKWREGFKSSLSATKFGVTAGFLGGAKAEKINTGVLKQGILKANKTEKVRSGEDGITFRKQVKETISQYSGVAGKYGDFNEFKNEIKELENKQRNYQSQETQLRRNMGDDQLKFANEYKVSDSDYNSLNEALLAGNSEAITKMGGEIWSKFEETLGSSIKNDSAKYAEVSKAFTDKFDQIHRESKIVAQMDKNNQKTVKAIADVQKKADSVNVDSK